MAKKNSNLILFLHVYFAVFIIAVIGVLVVKFYTQSPETIEGSRSYAVNMLVNYKADGFDNVLRERKENLIYVLSVFFVTALSFLSLFISNRYLPKVLDKVNSRRIYSGVVYFSILALPIFLYFAISPSYQVLKSGQKIEVYSSFATIGLGIFLTLGVIMWEVFAKNTSKCMAKIIFILFAIIAALLIVSYAVFDQSWSGLEGYAINFSPVTYPIIQQYLGNNLLVDFKSYYGLYPYFLQLFLYIFSATILTLSSVLALLFLASLLSLAFVIFTIIENKFLALLGFIAVIFIQNFAIDWWPKELDVQFQYESIRLLFPALFLAFLCAFYKNPSTKKYYFGLAISSAATLWNLDSGIAVFFTAVIIFGHENLKNNFSWKLFFAHLLKSFAVLAFAWTLMIIFVKINSSHWPNISWIFYGQQAAFDLAIAMLPSDAAGLWYITVLTYIIGLILSINNFLTKQHSLQNSLMLALTVMGVGLFVYFIGRGHEANLLHCSYPAVILLVIFADKFCRNFSGRALPDMTLELAIFSLPLLFVAYLSSAFFFNLSGHPLLKEKFITKKFSAQTSQSKPYWVLESEFIKKNIQFDGKTVRDDILTITTNDQDFYFDLEFLTKSPLNIINIRQTFYQKEIVAIEDLIKSKKEKFAILILSKKKEVPPSISDEEIKNLQKLLNQYYKLSAQMKIGDSDGVWIYKAKN